MCDVIVDVPPESQVHKQVVRKDAEKRDITLNPSTKLFYVEVEQPDIHNPSGDLDRLLYALKKQWGFLDVTVDIKVLQYLQKILRSSNWKVTCAVNKSNPKASSRIEKIWPGLFNGPIYGLAVDLGSTTIALHICDLLNGKVLKSSGIMNPQIRFGEDLMSRVSYAMLNPQGTLEMTNAVRLGLNDLIIESIKSLEIEADDFFEMTIVCNPIMHHLLLGIDPTELGQAPFALATSQELYLRAMNLDLNSLPNTNVYILPAIAGHVGADAAAVALAEAPNEAEEITLIIDVGTNAEIILGNKNQLLACSSPTGPAFEGAQISCGQRAAPGAIERVEIDPETKEARFKIIGCDEWLDSAVLSDKWKCLNITGICGSGIIEAIAEMRTAGIIDSSGLIGSFDQVGSERCITDGRTQSYIIFDGQKNDGPLIKITNGDIRAIQLAKAALYAGARLLMDQMKIEKVDKIVLAGAFGAHISAKHALILGMIPDCPLDKVSSAGNAAGTGARIALLNSKSREQVTKLVEKIIKVETAMEPRFQEHFIAATAIPNSIHKFPELEKIVTFPKITFNAKKGERRTRSSRQSRS